MKTILVPLDGSSLSQRALPYATALAKRTGAKLLLTRAVLANPYANDDVAVAQKALIGDAEFELDLIAKGLRVEGVEAEPRVVHGPGAPAILNEAKISGADMVVMSTHGRGGLGRLLYGSVADRVLRGAEIPVLAVQVGASDAWKDDAQPRILVPLDGSETAEAVLASVSVLARALNATIVLLGVIEPVYYAYPYGMSYTSPPEPDAETSLAIARTYLETQADRLRADGYTVNTIAQIGQPIGTIVEVARAEGVHAVAMATHGRGGLERLVMGSVATGVLQRVDVPVLLTRPITLTGTLTTSTDVAESGPSESATSARNVPVTALALSIAEVEMIRYGLDLLVSTTDRDEQLTGPIRHLLERLDESTPSRRALASNRV